MNRKQAKNDGIVRKKRDPFAIPAKSRKAGPFKKNEKVKHKKKLTEEE